MTPPPIIERATEADIPALVALLAELFSIERDFSPDAERQRAGLGLLIAAPDERATVLVARDGAGAAIAMVSAQLVVSTAEGAPSAWVEDLVITRGWRRKGVGRALVGTLLEWCRAHGAVRAQLLADMDNAAAFEFYERLGWRSTSMGAWRRGIG